MGSSLERQEVINTPEAKGMRLEASARGMGVNLGQVPPRRRPATPPRRVWHAGWDDRSRYEARKAESLRAPLATQAAARAQIDPQLTEAEEFDSGLRLPMYFSGFDSPEWASPELQIAAGPRHLLVTVNQELAVFDKTGCRLCRCDLGSLFAPLVGNARISTPRVIYDQFQESWLLAACARDEEARKSWFLLATSQGRNPQGDWWTWALDVRQDGDLQAGRVADWLGLSVDHNSVYLTANLFAGNGQFLHSKLRILNKKELEAGSVLHGWDFWDLRNADGSPSFSIQPALNLRAAGVQYLLNATQDGQGLTLWSISQTPRQPPKLSRRFVPTVPCQVPPQARQPMSQVRLDTGDARLGNVVFRHGQLYTARTIAANWGGGENVAAIQWFQLNPRAGCILQQGIYGAPEHHYFAPAVMVDGEGNLAMVFNRTGETEPPSIRFTGRWASEEPDRLRASELLHRGAPSGEADWSAFCGAGISPQDPEIWILGQYAPTEADWATWIGAVSLASPEEEALPLFRQQGALAG